MSPGNEIIEWEKSISMYGHHFSYEQYQELKAAETWDEVNPIILSSKLNFLYPHQSMEMFIKDLELYRKLEEYFYSSQTINKMGSGGCLEALIVILLVLPVTMLIDLFRIQGYNKLKQKRLATKDK